jgi:putative addiction module component (TIGR02574 family)
MLDSYDAVLQGALNLPEGDQARLVDALIAQLAPEHQLPFDEAWLEEIERRSREYDEGKTTAIPWEEVRLSARKRLGLDV